MVKLTTPSKVVVNLPTILVVSCMALGYIQE